MISIFTTLKFHAAIFSSRDIINAANFAGTNINAANISGWNI